MLHQFKSPPYNEMMTLYFQNFKFNSTSVIDYLDESFKSYPNTYYTKVRGTAPKNKFDTKKWIVQCVTTPLLEV
jgi:hypothetical protein